MLKNQDRELPADDAAQLREIGFRSLDFSELALRVEDETGRSSTSTPRPASHRHRRGRPRLPRRASTPVTVATSRHPPRAPGASRCRQPARRRWHGTDVALAADADAARSGGGARPLRGARAHRRAAARQARHRAAAQHRESGRRGDARRAAGRRVHRRRPRRRRVHPSDPIRPRAPSPAGSGCSPRARRAPQAGRAHLDTLTTVRADQPDRTWLCPYAPARTPGGRWSPCR
ncbi:hypothetical protein NKG94_20215 [Micromonospora sp. M12]